MITFLRFARAHTVVGTTLSLVALYCIAVRFTGATDHFLLAWTLFSCLAANVYITGLNQLTDVEIDRINKPYLPLASGAYSLQTGRIIVGVCGLLAVLSCLFYPPYLPLTVLSSLLLGTVYSAEPIRLKRYHFWAAFCIIVVRGLIVNLLLYLHFRTQLGAGAQVQGTVWLLTAIILVFGVIIAWFKDLPDTEGDAVYGIRTLTLLRSREWVYGAGSILLATTLVVAAGLAWWLGKPLLGACLLVLLLGFAFLASRLDLEQQSSIARFYQGTWGVFFGVYLVFAVLG